MKLKVQRRMILSKDNFITSRRDFECLRYLHAVKVATAKQIHKAIFKKDYSNFYKKLKKYEQLCLIRKIAGGKDFDASCPYVLSEQGLNTVRSNLSLTIAHNRFKSNSIHHDLFLVEIKRILEAKKMITGYYTENQIQTYTDFNHDEKLIPFKTLCCDAMFTLQNNKQSQINVALEFELSDKSSIEYKKKISNYYLEDFIHIVFYVCEGNKVENKIRQLNQEICNSNTSKIFIIQYSELIKEKEITNFNWQNNQHIPVS